VTTDQTLNMVAASLIGPLTRIANVESAIENMRHPRCLYPDCGRKASHTTTLLVGHRQVAVKTCCEHAKELAYSFCCGGLNWGGQPVVSLTTEKGLVR